MNVVGNYATAIQRLKEEKEKEAEKIKNANTVPIRLYRDPPNYDISLDDFEVYAFKRLRVLRKIEQCSILNQKDEERSKKIKKAIDEENLNKDEKLDEASHFILRLSYCQTEELRRWFLTQETALFYHRLQSTTSEKLAEAVQHFAQLKPISKAEKNRLNEQLVKSSTLKELADDYYAVPFAQALSLVHKRQCYLQNGYAYVPHSRVLSVLREKFRAHLSRELVQLVNAGAFKAAQEAESTRLYPLLKNMHESSLAAATDRSRNELSSEQHLTADNVEDMVSSMPLCMRQIHTGLKQDHHLKHHARVQYGFFLRGARLPFEDALLFFRKHFTRVTGERFQKEYAYNIRHWYGKAGRIDENKSQYAGFSCSRIMNGPAPGAGEHHGCPFKHYDEHHLSFLLQRLQVGTEQDRKDILRLKKENEYQLACVKHFEVTHPDAFTKDIPLDNLGNHPNAWFNASLHYHEKMTPDRGDGRGSTAETKTTTTTAAISRAEPVTP